MSIAGSSRFIFIMFCACQLMALAAGAKNVHNKHYKFSVTLPDAMLQIQDTAAGSEGMMYYDTAANIILMISQRQSKFHSVDEYINCSQAQLENELKDSYSDSTLTLINCSRSEFYPEQATVLLFHEQVLPYGFNTCLVYFVHHRHRDLQFSFTYKDGEPRPDKYIRAIMETLKLR